MIKVKDKEISNIEKNLMTEWSIWKTILIFSIPLILGNLLQQTYNTIDSMIVGNFVGSSALAAVGSSTALINLLISFAQGIAVGSGIIVAQSLGSNARKDVRDSIHTSMALALVLGIAVSILGYIFARWLLEKMQTPSGVMP